MIDNMIPRETEMKLGIHELVEIQAKLNPYREAIRFNREGFTYEEVNLRSNQLARFLMEEGIEKGMLVGLCIERSEKLIITMNAILKIGATFVPLDPKHPRQRNENILMTANISYLVTQMEYEKIFNQLGLKVLSIHGQDEKIGEYESNNLNISVEKDQLCYVIFTSGSTGNPKGVMIAHRNVINILNFMKDKLDVVIEDKLLAVTTVTFDISVLELFLPLISGSCVVIADDKTATDAKDLERLFYEENITIMQATPATWYMLLETKWNGSSSLRILCGGEAWSAKLADSLLEHCKSLWNVYGPTETTIWSTIKQIHRGDDKITLGQPVSLTTLYIVDEEGKEVDYGETGELYIGGAGVGIGYINDPVLTAEKFINNPFMKKNDEYVYKTGDIVKKIDDCEIEYVQRADFQVKIRGFRIELGEIEKAILQHPLVNQVVVVVKMKDEEKYLSAYISTKSGEIDQEELYGLLKSQLPYYMIPVHIHTVNNFPMTTSGKVNRKALEALADSPVRHNTYAVPVTDTEKKIFKLWSELLDIQDFGIHDNFLELGGHSLMANRLVLRMNNLFGSQVTLLEILTGGLTIHDMAKIVEDNLISSIPEDELNALLKEVEGLSPEEIAKFLDDYVIE